MKPCRDCPFKVGSPIGYDIDAIEAFHGGENTPACHKIVGTDAIFATAPMDPEPQAVCRGYEAWLADKPGFQIPAFAQGGNDNAG